MKAEAVHMRPMPDTAECEVHAWSNKELRHKLVPTMRARHGKGGLTVCRECLTRTREYMRSVLAKREARR